MNQRGYTVIELLVALFGLASLITVVIVVGLIIKILWRMAFP